MPHVYSKLAYFGQTTNSALPGRRYSQSWLRIPAYRRENKESEPFQIQINYRVHVSKNLGICSGRKINNNLMIIYARGFANIFTIMCSSFKSWLAKFTTYSKRLLPTIKYFWRLLFLSVCPMSTRPCFVT